MATKCDSCEEGVETKEIDKKHYCRYCENLYLKSKKWEIPIKPWKDLPEIDLYDRKMGK